MSQNCNSEILHNNLSDLDLLELIREKRQIQMLNNNFKSDLFENNPLIKYGRKMYEKLEETVWTKCVICKECDICFPLNEEGKCDKCSGNGIKAKIFHNNDLDPG